MCMCDYSVILIGRIPRREKEVVVDLQIVTKVFLDPLFVLISFLF